MNRPTLAVAVITAAAAITTALAPPAQAYGTATTVVTFGGTGCIQIQSASIGNPYRLSRPTTRCNSGGSLVFVEAQPAGALIGIDPIMGNADWIGCTIDDGWNTYTDFATRGDGTDVNCLRTAT